MSRLILLLILTTAVSISYAKPPLSIQVQPAWNGLTKAGTTTTEIAITLLADRNGEVEVTLPDHDPRLRVSVSLNALQPHTLWLAVRPQLGKVLRVNARGADGEATGAVVRFDDVAEDASVVASTIHLSPQPSSPGLQDMPMLLNPSISMLPHTPGGYGGINALILDGDSLAALDKRQLVSLQDYGADCGHIVYVGEAAARYEDLAATAGCGLRFITRVTDGNAALTAVQEMQRAVATALPSANRLQTLLNNDVFAATWSALLLFFIVYAIGLMLIARGSRKWAPLLLVPIVAALLGWTAWSNDRVNRRLISWSEVDTHGHTMRYSALLQIAGNGKGEASTVLPASLGLLQPQTEASMAELDSHDAGTVAAVLRARSFLLSQRTFFTQGNMRLEPSISITMTAHGPVIENRGATPSPPALLGWNDQRNPVPVLRPGERWHPPAHGTPWQVAHVEEQLLRMRTQDGTAAILLPHSLLPADGDVAHIEESGWLLIVSS